MSTSQLLIEYLTWRHRIIPANPRTTHRSTALTRWERSATARLRGQLQVVLEEIRVGTDLTPRLSRLVREGFRVASPGRRRRDQDPLLNDWGVHHLHLGGPATPGQFAERTGDLLYAAFTPTDAYAIGVFAHDDWVNDAVLKIMAGDWPDRGIILGGSDCMRLERKTSSEERRALRQAGVTVLFEHRGRVFLPRWGVTTTGTAIVATMNSNAIMHAIARAQAGHDGDATRLWRQIPLAARPSQASDCVWHLYLTDADFGAEEQGSGARISLGAVR